MTPQPLTYLASSSSSSSMGTIAKALANRLSLEAPALSDHRYWSTEDRFLRVGTHVVRSVRSTDERVQVIISFHGATREQCRSQLKRMELEDSTSAQRLGCMMQVQKKVRTERVVELLQWMHSIRMAIDPNDVSIHRGSNRFSAVIALSDLPKLLDAHRRSENCPIRRVVVEDFQVH